MPWCLHSIDWLIGWRVLESALLLNMTYVDWLIDLIHLSSWPKRSCRKVISARFPATSFRFTGPTITPYGCRLSPISSWPRIFKNPSQKRTLTAWWLVPALFHGTISSFTFIGRLKTRLNWVKFNAFLFLFCWLFFSPVRECEKNIWRCENIFSTIYND